MKIRIVKKENDVAISSEIISEDEFREEGGDCADTLLYLLDVCSEITLVEKDKKRTSWTYSIAPE